MADDKAPAALATFGAIAGSLGAFAFLTALAAGALGAGAQKNPAGRKVYYRAVVWNPKAGIGTAVYGPVQTGPDRADRDADDMFGKWFRKQGGPIVAYVISDLFNSHDGAKSGLRIDSGSQTMTEHFVADT